MKRAVLTDDVALELADVMQTLVDETPEHLIEYMRPKAIQECNRLSVEHDISLEAARLVHMVGTHTVAKVLVDISKMANRSAAMKAFEVHVRMACAVCDALASIMQLPRLRLRQVLKDSLKYGAELYAEEFE